MQFAHSHDPFQAIDWNAMSKPEAFRRATPNAKLKFVADAKSAA